MTATPTFDAATHAYTDATGRRLLSVTEVIKAVGLIDDRWFTEEATWRGSCVHALCEYEDKGTLDESTIDPAAEGYLEAWRRWKKITGFTPVQIEHPMSGMGYAGTLDRVGLIGPATRAVVDLKTGAAQKWHALQLAGYAGFYYPYSRSMRRFTVRLHEDGRYTTQEYEDFATDWAGFQGALAVATWKMVNNAL